MVVTLDTETEFTNEGGPIRRSVEIEYWVIDERGRLTEPGDLLEASPGVEEEFVAPLLEIKTTPCESTDELRDELFGRLGRVLRRAEEQGKRLVPLATPIHHGPIEDRPNERTRIQDRVLGENFEYVRHCAGTHIHIEQQPGREIDQLNTLIALDPALALVNSSPYFGGTKLAAGARSQLYRRLAYAALAHQGELWPYAADRKTWARRVDRCYEEFLTEAVISGFDQQYVQSHFEPEGTAWTPVKLRDRFSTVEWRSPDTALPSQVVRLADEIAGIVGHATEVDVRIEGETGRVTSDSIVLPEFEALRSSVDTAIRDGLSSSMVRSYLGRMGFDVSAYDPLSHDLLATAEPTRSETRTLRIQYADRLEQDLSRGAPSTASDGQAHPSSDESSFRPNSR
ncbi:glutamate-cysteine ligase family protein [Natronococcus sp. A-GB1]|uniref:glutamate-cysteine ligase family protein n=1 Tax=Natronococcus sp. A-GB1 TaxID=3037648 RepID=UPI00241F1601|nr:glutamate-cysteine ligase family protein [Natronococcus sp. A-GB1]MDG5758441.1 glutamate-cysteine ligase family protein [Natronococcus sp. A-GB1]